jgi:spore coat protein U-like protein
VKRGVAGFCLMLGIAWLPQSAWSSCLLTLCTCSVSATPVGFGVYDPFGSSPSDSSGTITVSCTGLVLSVAVSYDILLNKGLYASSFLPRQMASGANRLNYNLYTDSARTIVWGDGTGGTSFVSDGYLLGLFTVNRDYTVYGRIPASQTGVHTGDYSDTITVTVNY